MPSDNINLYLEKVAGQRAFSKGMRLHEQKKVRALQRDQLLITAIVEDNTQYRVSLSLVNDKYEGQCECDVSEGFEFCQHCVAVALANDEQEQELERLRSGDAKDRIAAYVSSLDEDDAKAMLLELMTKQTDDLNKWQIIADISAKKANIKDICDIINTALPVREVWRKDRVKTYFDLAITKLNAVHDILPRLPAENAVEITEYALKRYDKVMNKIKDDKSQSLKVEYLFTQWLIQFSEACAWPIEQNVSFLKNLYLTHYANFTLRPVLSRFFTNDIEQKEAIVQSILEWRESLQADQALTLTEDLRHYFMLNSDWKSLISISEGTATEANQKLELLGYYIKAEQVESAKDLMDELQATTLSQTQITKLQKLELALQGATSPKEVQLKQLWDIFESNLEPADLQAFLNMLDHLEPEQVKNYQQKAENLAKMKLSEKASPFDNDKLVAVFMITNNWQAAYQVAMQSDLKPTLLHQLAQKAIAEDYDTGLNLYRKLIMHYPAKTTHEDYMTAINLLNELKEALLFTSKSPEKAKLAFDFLVSELNYEFKQKRKFLALLGKYYGL